MTPEHFPVSGRRDREEFGAMISPVAMDYAIKYYEV
jgi:hypothetical protein